MEPTSTVPDAVSSPDAGAKPDAEAALERAPDYIHQLPWTAILLGAFLLALAGALAVFHVKGEGLLLPALCLVFCILATLTDLATGHIPNVLTYTGVLLGLALAGAGWVLELAGAQHSVRFLAAPTPVQSLLGAVAFAGIGILCMLGAGMGGGDMKLLTAIGAMLGFGFGGQVLIYASLVAFVYALLNLLIAGRLNAALRAISVELFSAFLTRRWPQAPRMGGRQIPLAVPVLVALPLARALPLPLVMEWINSRV